MRRNPLHEVEQEEVVRAMIRANPWATLVSHSDDGLVASHYPVLLDEESTELAVLTHVGRPDDQLHGFGDREALLIITGPHGYISPSWYSSRARPVPTWNFSAAHCYGIPEVLDPEENLRVLARLVHHFERHVQRPVELDEQVGRAVVPGTVGLRLEITRFICKVKMSQDKDAQSQRQVLEALRRPGPYANAPLADEMEHALGILPARGS